MILKCDYDTELYSFTTRLGSSKSFSAKATELKPDIVIMDLVMPKLDGTEATRAIRGKCPDIKVLILTTFGTSADVARAVSAGASSRSEAVAIALPRQLLKS